MATLEGMLKANQTKIEQLSIELKVSETGKFGSDAHASLLKFQTRQLLHEIAVMTVEREEQRAAQSTQHAEGRRAHLIHSEQHEDLGTWEELERQNAGYKEQIVQLGTQITILKAQKEELEKEKAAQQIAQVRERAQSTIVPPKKRAPDPAQEENVVLIQSIMMDLQKKLSALNEELSEVKEKYFYDLAERIKKKLRSKVQLPRLYSEFLSHGPQRVDMWADWITAMIKAEM